MQVFAGAASGADACDLHVQDDVCHLAKLLPTPACKVSSSPAPARSASGERRDGHEPALDGMGKGASAVNGGGTSRTAGLAAGLRVSKGTRAATQGGGRLSLSSFAPDELRRRRGGLSIA